MLNLKNKQNLLYFAEKCRSAELECPNNRGRRINFEKSILTGSISSEDVFNYYDESEILWDKGYYCYLPDDVLELFNYIESAKDNAIKSIC